MRSANDMQDAIPKKASIAEVKMLKSYLAVGYGFMIIRMHI